MATDKEASFPIENWEGINLNVDSEDIAPNQMLATQNLWEKTIGQLETRYGSKTVLKLPEFMTRFGDLFKIYKSWGEKVRMCTVSCDTDVGNYPTLPDGVSLQFVTNVLGYWNNTNAFGGTTFNMTHRRIVLRFVGYGRDRYYEIPVASVSGYAALTNQILRVTVSGAFDNSRTTGIEVYATVKCGTTATVTSPTASSPYQEQTMWCGFIDVHTNKVQTVNFEYSPAGFHTGITGGTTISATERSFTVSAQASGVNNVFGTFQGGKTYYVAVIPQYIVFQGSSDNRCCYQNANVDIYGGNVVPVTIPGDGTGYISIKSIAPNTVCFLVAIGEDPQTLQPIKIFNDSTFGGGSSTPPTVISSGEFFIENPVKNNPGLVDIRYVNDGEANISFRFSDFSRHDMLIGVNNDGSYFPIFCSRLSREVNDARHGFDILSTGPTYDGLRNKTLASAWYWAFSNMPNGVQRMGDRSNYNFTKWRDLAFFVSDFNQLRLPSTKVSTITFEPVAPRVAHNVFVCDGAIAGPMIEDAAYTTLTGLSTSGATAVLNVGFDGTDMIGSVVQVTGGTNFTQGFYTIISASGTNVTLSGNYASGVGAAGVMKIWYPPGVLPNMKYISRFENSIVLGGGQPGIDPINGGKNDSSKAIYFSRSENPTDFTIAGASSSIYQVIPVDDDGEDISGFGIYTNTTSDQGPISQLLTLKKSATWIMNTLPVANNGNLGGFNQKILSGKVGGYHRTVMNTPIGTLMTGPDNVYLIRENGEPTPMGQCISPMLKACDMSKAVASYHDRHYKISFPRIEGGDNDTELWLNIDKVIEKKGAEDWVGPMVGRGIDSVFVEDKDKDGYLYDKARDRFAVERARGRIYVVDTTPLILGAEEAVLYDCALVPDGVNLPVTAKLVTKDFDITQQDNNWSKLYKRAYLKCRTNFYPNAVYAAMTTPPSSHLIAMDGVPGVVIPLVFGAPSNGRFALNPLKLMTLFPSGRLIGRTMRLEFTFTHRIGIGGIQLNYQTIRRRL